LKNKDFKNLWAIIASILPSPLITYSINGKTMTEAGKDLFEVLVTEKIKDI